MNNGAEQRYSGLTNKSSELLQLEFYTNGDHRQEDHRWQQVSLYAKLAHNLYRMF